MALWLRLCFIYLFYIRVSLNGVQSEFERERQIFCVAWKTELIITITNVCCLHLWVYVFISALLYLYACYKQFEFQTFGVSIVLQFLNERVIVVSIFMVGCTETLKQRIFCGCRCSLLLGNADQVCQVAPVRLTVPMLSNFISSLNNMFESDGLLRIFSLHKHFRCPLVFVAVHL